MRTEHVGIVIERPVEEVYAFAAETANLPRWAAGLARGDLRTDDDGLIVDSPMGEVRVRFVAPNDLGVLDHDVTLPSGEVVTNPLRAIAHPDGAEVVFTIRQRDMGEDEFEADIAAVAADLARLKDLLEAPQA